MTISISNKITFTSVLPWLILILAGGCFVVFLTGFIRHFELNQKTRLWGIVLSLLVLLIAALILLPDRSPVPLFAPGAGTGEESRYFAGEEKEGQITIRVAEDTIYLGGVRCADAGDLKERLHALEPGQIKQVVLMDDYAKAATYHEAEEALAALELTWEKEESQ
ncbi:MAG: hypothetical protein K5696_11970 [Lachnospiraceae bacterium]|nr:hypothetical protein [Lachnospiraceae bacterium]